MIFFTIIFQVINAQKTNWQTDLETYSTQLEAKHIDLYNKISKQDFQKSVERIQNIAKSEDDLKTIIELMKLTKKIGDGHTAVSLRNLNVHQFPFDVQLIENQWRVVKTISSEENILKTSLIKVDGVPISEVVSKVSEVVQFVENEHSKIVRTASNLTISELLYHLNIIKNKKTALFTFLDDYNNEIEVEFTALKNTELKQLDYATFEVGVPEITKPKNTKFDFLWFAPIKNKNAIYVNFKSYPSFDEMQVFGENLVKYITENNTKNIVIDLRKNGGGDLYVGVVLAYALNLADTIDWKNGVYVLTSNITFSAGTSNAALFKQLLNAKIVGQPTGSNPTGYQDMDQFQLPNSKLVITYSKRRFRLSEKITQGIQPDILLYPKWGNYTLGKDDVLSFVIENFTFF
ncbi:S41 family peptidase [Polaribacter reichenbachii]|uniref:S41 family peptidase n=1 Tax=Polaribacter reichenbachii TaxID=996801 RepID=UPI001D0012CE|nr:S41 family peptidase [Polaribacter reichenbachii]